MTSKLLLDNIATLNSIAQGMKWQLKHPLAVTWEKPLPGSCPIIAIIYGYEIRLAPEKKWVDFSHAPEKRPKMAMVSNVLRPSEPISVVSFNSLLGGWSTAGQGTFTDHEMLCGYRWVHEDGTVTQFGAEVEG